MAVRSNLAQAARLQQLRDAVETATLSPQADYTTKRLARVRLQLDRLDNMLLTERDPQRLDRIASAQARISEQERILSGRPMPGSLRPRSERQSKRVAAEPLQDDAQA